MNQLTHKIEIRPGHYRLGHITESPNGTRWFRSYGSAYQITHYKSNQTDWIKLSPSSRTSYKVEKI